MKQSCLNQEELICIIIKISRYIMHRMETALTKDTLTACLKCAQGFHTNTIQQHFTEVNKVKDKSFPATPLRVFTPFMEERPWCEHICNLNWSESPFLQFSEQHLQQLNVFQASLSITGMPHRPLGRAQSSPITSSLKGTPMGELPIKHLFTTGNSE